MSADELKTADLLERIEADYGLRLDARTVQYWTTRLEDPMPVAYKGKSGQANRYNWDSAREWVERNVINAKPDGSNVIDAADWHQARTISARTKAKRDLLELGVLEEKYGDLAEVARTAEDRARHAVLQLRAIPSRLAPRLALLSDEIECGRLLAEEIRTVCQEIERSSRLAIGDDLESADSQEVVS